MRAWLLPGTLLLASLSLAQDYGLLLGIDSKEDGLKTVFVQHKGVATMAREAAQGCLLWTKNGFIQVSTDSRTTEGSRNVIITAADGTKNIVSAGEGRPETFYQVAYISPFGIGLTSSMQGPSVIGAGGGGGFPARYPTTFRNYQWSSIGTASEIGAAFEKDIVNEFNRRATTTRASDGMIEHEASPTNWILYHSQGLWQLYGRLMPIMNFDNNQGEVFLVSTATDKKFGATDPGPKWTRVRTEYPDVIDMVTSPDGKMTVIVTPDTVFVHESNGSTLGRKLQQVRTECRNIVMTQWLEAEDFARAAAALDKRN